MSPKDSITGFFKGGISRKVYWLRAFVSIFLSVLIGIYLTHPIFTVFICLGLIYFIVQTIKRLRDLNLNGWFTLLMIVPVLNILFGAYVLLKKGKA